MQRRRFGPASREVAVIGQGTWLLQLEDRASAIRALRVGLDLGMTHVDTAELYGAGKVEELVGAAISGRRDEVFLVSNVRPENASATGTIAACERSLARLQTDRLDCYLLHWRGVHALEETIDAFERLERDGKILGWGVSNFDVPDLEDVRRIAPAARPMCNQVLYHLRERAIEHAVVPWCEKHGVAIVGYSALGHGSFPNPYSAGGRVLRQIANLHGATPSQVALAFLVRRPSTFAIVKTGDPDHTAESAQAGDLRLRDAEIERIEQAFPLAPLPPELLTL
jgi:diketogulonate reductase-like aldo/keto reductase